MNRSAATAAGALLVFVTTIEAEALPRFAARTGSKCQSCHINPSGGAMRQTFGMQYGREKLPVPAWSPDFELEDFTNLLTNFLGVGVDFRTLYLYQEIPDTAGGADGKKTTDAFWQMQGDLYLNLKVAKKVGLFLKKGLYSGFEVFGLLSMLPANGHIKVGKFIPNYGTKIDDHTAYIRTYTGFSPVLGRPELTGLEAGVSPGVFTVVGGLYNAEDGFGSAASSSKAYLGRAEAIVGVSNDFNVGLGGNLFATTTSAGDHQRLYGGFASASYSDLTVFGEADWIATDLAEETQTGFVAYVEANFLVTPGVDIKAAYDFYDEDLDYKTGSVSRYSLGFEFFPIVGVELRPMYRIVVDEPRNVKNNEFHFLLHFYL